MISGCNTRVGEVWEVRTNCTCHICNPERPFLLSRTQHTNLSNTVSSAPFKTQHTVAQRSIWPTQPCVTGEAITALHVQAAAMQKNVSPTWRGPQNRALLSRGRCTPPRLLRGTRDEGRGGRVPAKARPKGIVQFQREGADALQNNMRNFGKVKENHSRTGPWQVDQNSALRRSEGANSNECETKL